MNGQKFEVIMGDWFEELKEPKYQFKVVGEPKHIVKYSGFKRQKIKAFNKSISLVANIKLKDYWVYNVELVNN